ncbi:hypothetical protein HAX54_001254, partial [Datura stramonium]|nr:hypothetical protein [Datura stramonium]
MVALTKMEEIGTQVDSRLPPQEVIALVIVLPLTTMIVEISRCSPQDVELWRTKIKQRMCLAADECPQTFDDGTESEGDDPDQTEQIGKSRVRVKAINSPPQQVGGTAKGVSVKLGPYEGKFNLRVVIIDDFEMIVGLEFEANPYHSGALCICVVHNGSKRGQALHYSMYYSEDGRGEQLGLAVEEGSQETRTYIS